MMMMMMMMTVMNTMMRPNRCPLVEQRPASNCELNTPMLLSLVVVVVVVLLLL